jgi:uncharacterized membrane protein
MKLQRALVGLAALWVAAIVAAPLLAASGTRAGSGCAALTYLAGSLVCHQIPGRSFHLAGAQLAVCGRCTGLYVSALAGGVAALVAAGGGLRESQARVWLALAAIPTAASWLLEHLGIAAQTNVIRATAALPLGLAAGWVCVRLLRGSADSPTS